jgi:hypothetical protein
MLVFISLSKAYLACVLSWLVSELHENVSRFEVTFTTTKNTKGTFGNFQIVFFSSACNAWVIYIQYSHRLLGGEDGVRWSVVCQMLVVWCRMV